ncbi:MAG: hypothetical protein CBARDMAM_6378 [uncultured Caballeronia sp.]|nr:MAG: hypothetical protein CBARDMAM_6378 [uncultured Caballeronia sp.]
MRGFIQQPSIIDSVGAPWDMKTVGRRVMAANLEKRRYHDYKDSRCVDKQPTRQ